MITKRFEYIDRLKGFAILCVVMGHYVLFVLGQTDIIAEIIGSFQMPLFMFMSGYVISSAPTLMKCCKKIITFLSPMLVVGSIFVFFSGSSLSTWIHTPFKYGYWYLYVLSVFYVILYIIGVLGRTNKIQALLALVFYLFLCVLNNYVPSKWNDIFSIWMLKLYWPFFIVAYFVRQNDLLHILTKKNCFYSFSLVGYIVGFFLYIKGHNHLFHLNAFFFIIIVVYIFVITEKKDSFITRNLSYYGRHTLDIYLFHFFIIRLTNLDLVGNWFVESGNILLEIISGIVYSVLVAIICILISKVIHQSKYINNVVFGSFVNKF